MITVDFNCLGRTADARILDIGCGSGRHVGAAYGLERAIVIGVDPNLKDLKAAVSRLEFHDRLGAHGGGRWRLSAADATALPFENAGFDLVICSEVLEHIDNHQHAMAEMVRVLRPGGHLVVSVPRRWPETLCWALSRQYRRSPGGHVRIYNAKSLAALIQEFGVTHWRTHYAHSLHTPYWWVRCLAGLDRENLAPVRCYHHFLTWEMMTKPRFTRHLEHWLNPLLGKSVVMYFRKETV
jgi:SAM-dependent methyltransferase